MVGARADRARGVVDGNLSGKLHPSDARGRRAAAGAARARSAGRRFAHRAAGHAHAGRGAPLMGRFAPFLPEIILAVGGMILMIVAAFAHRRAAGVVSWLAVALLLAATAALVGAPSHAGPIFGGMVSADLFASFGKAIIFPAAAVSIVAAHGWFERESEHASEYSVLIVFAAVGMSVMVSATSLVALYVGLELNSLAGY